MTNKMNATWLLQQWDGLAARAALEDAQGIGERLLACYAEPHRAYHTSAHLRDVLERLQDVLDDRLQLAAWFHDAVYDPRRRDNEERSAMLALRLLLERGYAPTDAAFVADAVRATAGHGGGGAVAPLLDADLAILAAHDATYHAYAAAVRREYAHVPGWMFARGRAAFLSRLLERPTIYLTPRGVACCEQAARENIRRELAGMKRGVRCA
jgi:predicted metal-dependent HD superfamily phosphohydrolase